MLAMADRVGLVAASVPGLADFARVSLPDCQKALAELVAPDEWSRSQENEGRRIQIVDGGWLLLNHAKYREKMGADERREYLKLKQREYRSKQKSTNVNKVSDSIGHVDIGIAALERRKKERTKERKKKDPSTEAEATPEAEATTNNELVHNN